MNGKIKAIVVEDEIKIGSYIKQKIEYLDSSFLVMALAENGRKALELIEKYRPQVVFTDISMPVMDGLELSRIIRNMFPGIIVVIISGYSDFGYAQKAIRYGVFNYVLKPLEDEKFSDVLFDIKKSLIHSREKRERQILYSDRYMLQDTKEKQYLVLSVCVGNLIYDVRETELTEHYRQIMEKIPWRQIMEDLCKGHCDWYLADEQAVNQKVAGIQLRVGEEVRPDKLAEELGGILAEYTELAVHVALSKKTVTFDDVQNVVNHLRFVLQKELIVGASQILYLEKTWDNGQELLEIVKLKLNSYIKNYFVSTDLKSFSGEIQAVLKYMVHNRASQQEIEKVSLYVLKMLEFSGNSHEPGFLEDMQKKLQCSIGLAATENELISRMMECFREIEAYMESLYERNLESRVLEYVDNNFLTLESLEQVADVFGYNYTYLSRMFKKISGMPMNKYITEKKINMAKELMGTYPDMMLEEVCGLCGYSDYRYFSRVFKSQTGMTPREYRDNC